MHALCAQVVHVGDQLEVMNGKRVRAEQAEKLMMQFNAFLSAETLPFPFDHEPIKVEELPEAAEMIRVCVALLYCVVLNCIVLYCIVLYCIVLYCIVLCCMS